MPGQRRSPRDGSTATRTPREVKGVKGDKGDDGRPPTAAEIDAAVFRYLDAHPLPKGDKGDKGDTGESIKGDQGRSIQGEKGEKGDPGPAYRPLLPNIRVLAVDEGENVLTWPPLPGNQYIVLAEAGDIIVDPSSRGSGGCTLVASEATTVMVLSG